MSMGEVQILMDTRNKIITSYLKKKNTYPTYNVIQSYKCSHGYNVLNSLTCMLKKHLFLNTNQTLVYEDDHYILKCSYRDTKTILVYNIDVL